MSKSLAGLQHPHKSQASMWPIPALRKQRLGSLKKVSQSNQGALKSRYKAESHLT